MLYKYKTDTSVILIPYYFCFKRKKISANYHNLVSSTGWFLYHFHEKGHLNIHVWVFHPVRWLICLYHLTGWEALQRCGKPEVSATLTSTASTQGLCFDILSQWLGCREDDNWQLFYFIYIYIFQLPEKDGSPFFASVWDPKDLPVARGGTLMENNCTFWQFSSCSLVMLEDSIHIFFYGTYTPFSF